MKKSVKNLLYTLLLSGIIVVNNTQAMDTAPETRPLEIDFSQIPAPADEIIFQRCLDSMIGEIIQNIQRQNLFNTIEIPLQAIETLKTEIATIIKTEEANISNQHPVYSIFLSKPENVSFIMHKLFQHLNIDVNKIYNSSELDNSYFDSHTITVSLLHYAILSNKINNKTQLFNLLLLAGADVNSKKTSPEIDNTKETPLDLAIIKKYKEIILMLINHPQIEISQQNLTDLQKMEIDISGISPEKIISE